MQMENFNQSFRTQCELISKKYDEKCHQFSDECMKELNNDIPDDKKDIVKGVIVEFLKQHFFIWNDSFLKLLRERNKKEVEEKVLLIMNYTYDSFGLCMSKLVPLKEEIVKKMVKILQTKELKFKVLFGQWWNIADNLNFADVI